MSIGKTSVEMLITNIYLWFWGIFVSPQEKVNNAVNCITIDHTTIGAVPQMSIGKTSVEMLITHVYL